jgi:hypothetical protein
MSNLSVQEEARLQDLKFKAQSGGYTPTEKAELAALEEKAAGIVHVPVVEEVEEAPEQDASDEQETNISEVLGSFRAPEQPQDATIDPRGTSAVPEVGSAPVGTGHEPVLE